MKPGEERKPIECSWDRVFEIGLGRKVAIVFEEALFKTLVWKCNFIYSLSFLLEIILKTAFFCDIYWYKQSNCDQ